jgi:UDP-glucose 4-epimerase
MKWLITGGCGFIGTNLIRHLRGKGGQSIRVFDDLSVGRFEDLAAVSDVFEADPSACEFPSPDGFVQLMIGDIANAEELDAAVRSADVVVHLAANTGVLPSIENPRGDCLTNVVGTLNALEAARRHGVGHFVFASSGAVLGEQQPPIHEALVPKPLSPYGASKLAGEGYCAVYAACFGIKTSALRFGNVYGPGSALKGSVVAKFIKQALRGETLVIFGDGAQTRDFIYIDDLVDAVFRAASLQEGGEVFQIATSRQTTVSEIAGMLSDLVREMTGRAVAVEHAQPRTGEILHNYADISKAQRVLGWSPTRSLREGLRETVRWYVDRQPPIGASA